MQDKSAEGVQPKQVNIKIVQPEKGSNTQGVVFNNMEELRRQAGTGKTVKELVEEIKRKK